MNIIFLTAHYTIWHYTKGIYEVFIVWKNIIWFTNQFFSIKLLLKTFFKPWKRLHEKHYRSEGVGEFFTNIMINTLMRIVGMVMRSIVIVLGLACMLLAIFSGLFLFGIWFLLPPIIFFIFIMGLYSLFKYLI